MAIESPIPDFNVEIRQCCERMRLPAAFQKDKTVSASGELFVKVIV
jgi:hypothetical protein